MCLKILIRANLFKGQKEKGIKAHRPILQGHVALIKIRDRKGPSRGVIPKCEPHERNPCAPRIEERTQGATLHQERCARGVAWDLAKHIYKLKNTDKATFYPPVEARAAPAPTSKSPEEREFVVDSGATMHMLSKQD